MADYFDEMGWQPIPEDQTQRHQDMLIIRELLASGMIREDLMDDLPPPASKNLVRNLEEKIPSAQDEACTICLKPNEENNELNKFKILPCSHEFHVSCILPWLNKTNSCPLCRYEMETDDKAYEEQKTFRKREAERDQEREVLHNSMFG